MKSFRKRITYKRQNKKNNKKHRTVSKKRRTYKKRHSNKIRKGGTIEKNKDIKLETVETVETVKPDDNLNNNANSNEQDKIENTLPISNNADVFLESKPLLVSKKNRKIVIGHRKDREYEENLEATIAARAKRDAKLEQEKQERLEKKRQEVYKLQNPYRYIGYD